MNDMCRLSVYSTDSISSRSPGSMQSCKVAFLYCKEDHYGVAVAEGDSVYKVMLPKLEGSGVPSDLKPGAPFRLKPGFHPSSSSLLFSFSSKVAVESITVVEQGEHWKILACSGIGETIFFEEGGRQIELNEKTCRPHSWAQSIPLCFCNNGNKIVTGHQMGKLIRVDDIESQQCISLLPTVFYPSSLTSYDDSSSSCFITTEYNQVNVWDIRASNPCVYRYQASSNWLYASAVKSNLIAVGGKNRIVEITDMRKWKFQSRWTNCLKYEVTSIHFSEVSEELCFVSGVDSEMVCGRWRTKQGKENATEKNSFRADSRWSGLSLLKGSDLLAGYNENGHVYIFEQASYLFSGYSGVPLSRTIGPGKKRQNQTKLGVANKRPRNQ